MSFAKTLETERLLLRNWKPQDLLPLQQINANPEVMRFYPSTHTSEETEGMMQRILEHFEKHGYGLCAVELKGTKELIGFVGLQHLTYKAPFTPCTEIGWRISHLHWRQGYAFEAACRILDFAFDELGIQEIIAMTSLLNLPSWGVMKKLGMTRDISENFLHPKIHEESPLKPHLLCRMKKQDWKNPNK